MNWFLAAKIIASITAWAAVAGLGVAAYRIAFGERPHVGAGAFYAVLCLAYGAGVCLLMHALWGG